MGATDGQRRPSDSERRARFVLAGVFGATAVVMALVDLVPGIDAHWVIIGGFIGASLACVGLPPGGLLNR